jgi:hypothetical protein
LVAKAETFFDLLKRSVERSRVTQEIRTTVRARSRGKTRDEARQILIDEIESRGQEVPAQPWLDARLDAILAGDHPGDRARATVEAVSALGEAGFRIYKMFKTHRAEDSDDQASEALQGFFAQDAHKSVEIELDVGVEEWIGHVEDEALFTFRDVSALRLTLHLSTDGAVVAHVGDRRVGTLDEDAAESFRPCFSMFGRQRQVLRGRGGRYRDPDGRWHVYVNLPDEHFLRLAGLDIDPGEDFPPEAMRQLFDEPIPPTPSGRLRYDRGGRRWVDGSDGATP